MQDLSVDQAKCTRNMFRSEQIDMYLFRIYIESSNKLFIGLLLKHAAIYIFTIYGYSVM